MGAPHEVCPWGGRGSEWGTSWIPRSYATHARKVKKTKKTRPRSLGIGLGGGAQKRPIFTKKTLKRPKKAQNCKISLFRAILKNWKSNLSISPFLKKNHFSDNHVQNILVILEFGIFFKNKTKNYQMF